MHNSAAALPVSVCVACMGCVNMQRTLLSLHLTHHRPSGLLSREGSRDMLGHKLGPDTAPVIRVTQIYFSRRTPPQRPSLVVRGSVFITFNELSWQISRATQKLIMAEFMCVYFKLVELISPLKMQVPRLPLCAAIILSACFQIRSNSPAQTHTSGRPCAH